MKQLPLIPGAKYPKFFGGSLLIGKRKSRRPLSRKHPTHLILKSDIKKSGSLRKHEKRIREYIERFAKKFNIKIYEKNVNFDHIQLVTLSQSILDFHNFNRVLAGVMAEKLKIAWLYRPYSRVIAWGKDLKNTCAYVLQNELEATGAIPYTPRKRQRKRKKEVP